MADFAIPVVDRIMDVIGLKPVETGDQERKEIELLVAGRNKLRAEKKFNEADEIRKKLTRSALLSSLTTRTGQSG